MSERTVVILVNYKSAKHTAECLRSLLICNPLPLSVVVDNTPDDDELENAISFYPRLNIIRAPDNLGFGKGNNLGIDWAIDNTNCEFLFILNNDTTVHPNCIQTLESAMDEHPETGIITSRIVLSEDHNKLWYGGGEIDWKRGSARTPGMLRSSLSFLAMESRFVTFATGCAMLIRRSAIEDTGGFDNRFFMYEEDLELSLRMLEHGWKIWYESQSLIYHVGHGSHPRSDRFIDRYSPKNKNLSFFVYHGTKNTFLNMNIHARGRKKLVFYIFFTLITIKRMVNWAMHGRFDALAALTEAFIDYRKMINGSTN